MNLFDVSTFCLYEINFHVFKIIFNSHTYLFFNILQTVKQVDELEEQEKDRVMAEVLFKEESKENICFK